MIRLSDNMFAPKRAAMGGLAACLPVDMGMSSHTLRTCMDKPGRAGQQRSPSGPLGVASAFTLTELVVAMGVLVILVMGFSYVLSQSQQLVVGSQQNIRINSAAAAVAEVLRQDLRNATKAGFLRLKDSDGDTKFDVLEFSTAGVTSSIMQNARGTGGVVRVGRESTKNLLYRQKWTLNGSGGTVTDDLWAIDLADIQDGVYSPLNSGTAAAPPSVADTQLSDLTAVPANLTQVDAIWQLLGANCTALTIDYAAAGSTLTWTNPSAANGSVTWTRLDGSAWPKLIRLRFTVTDPLLPAAQDYEVICTVGE